MRGSAATAVHGVEVSPADVDVLVHPDTMDDVLSAVAERLAPFVSQTSPGTDLEVALSTSEQAFYEDDGWAFGRWLIHGTKLEIARIREPAAGDLLLETMGPAVWQVRQQVFHDGRPVPVVPLEVQLATILARRDDTRAVAVRRRLSARGCDADLLDRALRDRGVGEGERRETAARLDGASGGRAV